MPTARHVDTGTWRLRVENRVTEMSGPHLPPRRWLACRKTVGLSLQAETREAPGDFSGWGSAGFRARQLTVVPLEHLGAGVSRASLTSDPPLKGSVASARWSVCWAPAGSFVPCHAGTGGLETCP